MGRRLAPTTVGCPRDAAGTHADPFIPLHAEREPSLLHRIEEDASALPRFQFQFDQVRTALRLHADDPSFEPPPVNRAQDIRPPPDEPAPFRRRAQGPLARRGHLQIVAVGQERTAVQSRLDGAGCTGTIVYRNLLAVTPINPDLDEGARLRAPTPELDKVKFQRSKLLIDKTFQLFVHAIWKVPLQKQKMWGTSPTFPRGNHRV